MSQDEFSGRPPKSSADIRRILKSIHNAIEAPHPGPYVRGFPALERKLVAVVARRNKPETRRPTTSVNSTPRSPAYYREMLLRRGGFAGGFIGLLIGLNFGLALPIILGNMWLFTLTPIVASLCGCAIGLSYGCVTVACRRRDLFSAAVSHGC